MTYRSSPKMPSLLVRVECPTKVAPDIIAWNPFSLSAVALECSVREQPETSSIGAANTVRIRLFIGLSHSLRPKGPKFEPRETAAEHTNRRCPVMPLRQRDC